MKTYLLIALGGVLVVGGGYVAWKSMGSQAPQAQEPVVTQDEASNESVSGTGSIASLMARGGNHECTMSIDVQNSQSEGTVYISGDRISGDFTSHAAGKTYTGHMVVVGGYAYSWSDAFPQGFKSKTTVTSQGGTQTSGFDVNTNMNYNCKPWTVEESKFAVPSTITFVEAGAQ